MDSLFEKLLNELKREKTLNDDDVKEFNNLFMYHIAEYGKINDNTVPSKLLDEFSHFLLKRLNPEIISDEARLCFISNWTNEWLRNTYRYYELYKSALTC